MSRPRRLAIVFSVLMFASALAGAGPTVAFVNRASIAVETTYLLKARLDFAAGTIAAAETIVVRNTAGRTISKLNLSVMPRAFGELTSISGFRVDGRSVSARWTNNSNLELQLGRDLVVGATAIVKLSFALRATGVIGTSLEGRLSKANGIMQVSHWFPIVSDGHPTRYPGDSQHTRVAKKIRLELTTDSSSVRIAAPGTRVSSAGRYHVYEIAKARDFAFGASPHYRVASGSAGGIAVSAYYTTGSGVTAVAHAMAALVRYEAVYGQYQWSRYVIAQTGRSRSGNEYPGIIFLGGPLFSDRAEVAHETAHQWWYAMAGNDQLREPWLDEGIAEFSTNFFFGAFHRHDSSRAINSTIYEFPNLPAPITAADSDSYNQTIYYRAANFLDGLRGRMGNADFFMALRELFAANRNGTVTSREFYDAMARHGAPTTYMRLFIRF